MNSKDRVKKAISRQKTDRIPLDLGGPYTTIEVGAYKKLLYFMGINDEPVVFLRAHVIPCEKMLDEFNIDTRYVYYRNPIKWNDFKAENNIYYDEWGLKWLIKEELFCHELIGSPLSECRGVKEELDEHKWPSITDTKDMERWKKRIKYLTGETDYFIIGDSIGWGIFEQSWGLRGIENFYIDLAVNKDFAGALMNSVLEVYKQRMEAFLKVIGRYIGAICISDDISGQDGPLMSPDMYREFIKPRHRELIDFIKNRTDAKIFFHCCGDVTPFIEDFIEIGVDILNPIQVSARNMNDTFKLKKDYGKRIIFWGGGCDSQNVLPYGSSKDVRKEVEKRIKDLNGNGGYVFAPVHNIQNEVPPQNIYSLYHAASNYRGQ